MREQQVRNALLIVQFKLPDNNILARCLKCRKKEKVTNGKKGSNASPTQSHLIDIEKSAMQPNPRERKLSFPLSFHIHSMLLLLLLSFWYYITFFLFFGNWESSAINR